MNIAKKPYEISLWEDELVWHVRELEPIQILEKDYKPGKFFSQDKNVFGVIPYRLDYNQYNDGQRYYTIKAEGLIKEGDSASQVKIENLEDWKNKEEIYEVKNAFANKEDWEKNEWFTFSNTSNTFEKSNEEKPSADKIYYVKKEVGVSYIPNSLQTFYKEVKLCIIGSDTMDSPARCVNPKLSQKVNGENSLTFTMYYRYWDDDSQTFVNNPFNRYMVNERKVKLRLGPTAKNEQDTSCKWFDFIIKNVQENSETKAFTYTCKDQFVNELSKSGFDLILDNELENNMGTIDTLAEYVLEGSDWKVDRENSENLKQYIEEPLYRIKTNISLTATSLEKIGEGEEAEYNNITVGSNQDIYVFYSIINNKNKKIQFLYPPKESEFIVNDDLLVDKELFPNYELDGEFEYIGEWPSFTKMIEEMPDASISTKYRGARLVKQTQTKYDSTIDKYVGVYKKKDGDTTYYGYTQSEYISSGAIVNYATNSNSFSSTSGWQTDANQLEYKLETQKNSNGLYDSYISFTNMSNAWVMNAGIGGNRSSIESFSEGEKYVLRIKYKIPFAKDNAEEMDYPGQLDRLQAKICEYELDENSKYKLTNLVEGKDQYKIFDFLTVESSSDFPLKTNELVEKKDENGNGTGEYEYLSYNRNEDNYIYMIGECAQSISKNKLNNWDFRVGLFLNFDTDTKIWIEDLQVFPYETYIDEEGNERLCVPGGKLHSEIKTKYIYYIPDSTIKSIDDLKPVYNKYKNDPSFEQQYNTNPSNIKGANEFTKVRSISGKESNRFNLIQDLCETFECWSKITVNRDQRTGKIYYGKDLGLAGEEAYRQQKFISFREYVGNENQIGFRYGVNSKSILRTVDSAAIVSKMVVKDNANEFAPNGFCSIARATENPSGENFLLNFNHYTQQKLLDPDVVTNDLYLDANGYIGYYKVLKRLNIEREPKIDKQSGLLKDIANYKASYTTYKTSYDNAVEQQLIVERDFCKLANKSLTHDNFAESVEAMIESLKTEGKELSDDLNKYWAKWCQCANTIFQHKDLYQKAEVSLRESESAYEEIESELKILADQKRALGLQFYKKYSRFIQEGSWIKEDYTDPNLYCLDALSTLHTSSQPKVTYNISVIDVMPLSNQEGYEDFKYYDFNIGDKSYIEDVEFFGWSLADRAMPYREEIVVSEITTELDAPEKNQIKVQNYKTQFEDLFQRITAQTQQAEYHTGEYNRAASIVETNGTIAQSALENSFANNSFTLSNARDQSVVWDESGITTTSLSNHSEMVRIISGGIFLSTDGGKSWKTGITGSGINTSYLTSGQIDTSEIVIRSGSFPTFRWDNRGLSAYEFSVNNQNNAYGFNTAKFVRYDQYGLYGINGYSEFDPTIAQIDGEVVGEEKIWNNAKFALTWKGFMLKNEDGSVRITSDNDIQVLEEELERIRIGRIGKTVDEKDIYGIRISKTIEKTDGTKEVIPVMETDDSGELWLKNRLRVGANNTSTVEIGYLDAVRENTSKHEVIHAGNQEQDFIVYEDGRVVANYIEANGGKIGNMTIGEVESGIESAKDIEIVADYGATFQIDANDVVTPKKLHFRLVQKNIIIESSDKIIWEVSPTFENDWIEINGDVEADIEYDSVPFLNNICYLRVTAIDNKGKTYSKHMTINRVLDGKHSILLVVTSTTGGIYINNNIKAELRATVIRNGLDITSKYDDERFVWSKFDKNGTKVDWKATGPIIQVTHTDVEQKATFSCELIQE